MFTGNQLRDAIISGSNNIFNQRKRVDELNVFPVPDGDTGTNMSMSIGNAAREISKIYDETVSAVSAKAASALLRGARGNSGVITSLLFRGFAQGFKESETVTAQNLVQALELGVKAAYKAVMNPTEGTILTVARVGAETAKEKLNSGCDDALTVFKAAIEGAKQALAETPNILPVLKKAGVVDAGGRGLVVIFEGMLSVFENGKMIELTQVEFQIMEYFFSNPGTALDRMDILNHVWGDAYVGEDKIVDVNIRRLRMKVEDEPSNPKYIITVWGLGYKWNA